MGTVNRDVIIKRRAFATKWNTPEGFVPVYEFLAADGRPTGCGTALEMEYWQGEGVFPKDDKLGKVLCYEPASEDERRRAAWAAYADRNASRKEAVITHYTVTNSVTGKVSTYKTSQGASRAMDRADRAYGRVITTRKAHWSDEAQ